MRKKRKGTMKKVRTSVKGYTRKGYTVKGHSVKGHSRRVKKRV